MKIYKYPLDNTTEIWVPKGAQFLDVALQGDSINAWYLVDPSKETEHKTLAIYPTGVDVGDNPGTHLGTVVTENMKGRGVNYLVWHVFDKTPENLKETS